MVKKESSALPHLIIDGYNVIHAWQELKPCLLKLGSEVARDQLSKMLEAIYFTRSLRLTIVFDGNGNDIEIVKPIKKEIHFSHLFSPKNTSADGLIVKLVEKNKKEFPLIVATDDSALRQCALTNHADVISSKNLKEWVLTCQKKQNMHIKQKNTNLKTKWKENPFSHYKKT